MIKKKDKKLLSSFIASHKAKLNVKREKNISQL